MDELLWVASELIEATTGDSIDKRLRAVIRLMKWASTVTPAKVEELISETEFLWEKI